MALLTPEDKHAFTFKKIADAKNISSMDEVFEQIAKEAAKGEYELNVKDNLVEAQIQSLQSLGFDVYEYDEEDEEYEQGFRFSIDWEEAENPND